MKHHKKPTGDSVTRKPVTNPVVVASDNSIFMAHKGKKQGGCAEVIW
jgi:hypothetical protein